MSILQAFMAPTAASLPLWSWPLVAVLVGLASWYGHREEERS